MSPAGHLWLRALALALAGSAILLAITFREAPVEPPLADSGDAAPVRIPTSGAANLPLVFERTVDDPNGLAEGLAGVVPLQLIGIAGRLPDDVEVLVRLPDGTSVTLQPGEGVSGWELVSASADRAVFARGAQRQVVLIEAP